MRKFLRMLLAVLFCVSAMCVTDVFAYSTTSDSVLSTNETIQDSVQNVKSTMINSSRGAYSDEEVYLMAQLIHHEAHNQSYNGKVAVAEVVLNRVKSSLFPTSISEVITQNGQFTSSRRIKNINPDELEVRIAYNVLNGNLRVLNDKDVMYFRNPRITSGISSKIDKDWGKLDYVTYIGDHAFYAQNTFGSKFAENIKTEKEQPAIIVERNDVAKNDVVNGIEVIKNTETEVKLGTTLVAGGTTEPNVTMNSSVDVLQMASNPLAFLTAGIAEQTVTDVNNTQEISNIADTSVDIPVENAVVNPVTSDSVVVDSATVAPVTEVSEKSEDIAVDEVIAPAPTVVNSLSDMSDASEDDLDDEFDLEFEEEEIDESDPVAVAQRQARRDERMRLKRLAMLDEAYNQANEAATELSEANVQQAVDRAEALLKAGQVSFY